MRESARSFFIVKRFLHFEKIGVKLEALEFFREREENFFEFFSRAEF